LQLLNYFLDPTGKVLKNSNHQSSKYLQHGIINTHELGHDIQDNEDNYIDNIKYDFLKVQKGADKADSKKKKLSEHNEITSAEIKDFHDKNDEELADSDDNDDNSGDNDTQIENKSTMSKPNSQQKSVKYIGDLRKRYPQAIIGGVKKSGTRALLSFLAKHPLVKSAGSEKHFFDRNETYEEGLDWYLEQMPESYENEITIEKTPGYYVKPYVPKRIYDFSKTVKLIFIYREPVERAISDYAQALANEKNVKFEKTVLTKSKPRKVNENASKVSIGLYAKHLSNWLQYFPKIQMHFVNGNDFIKNPVPIIIEVQKFLGLPVMLNENNFVYDKIKGFYCIKATDDIQEVKCLGDSKGRPHPYIKPATLRKLKEFYKPHNELFFNLIGKDFGWATTKFDPSTTDNDKVSR